MEIETKYEPLSRWGHTTATIGDRIYMWGGRIDDFSEESKRELASVVEVFIIPDETWERKKTKGAPPPGLYNNAFAVVGNELYVYGGWDGHSAHDTLHHLNVDTLTWEETRPKNDEELPMKMSGCGLVATGNNTLVLFGGYGLPSAAGTPKKKGTKINLVTKSSKTATPSPVLSQKSSVQNHDSDGERKVDLTTDKEEDKDVPTSTADAAITSTATAATTVNGGSEDMVNREDLMKGEDDKHHLFNGDGEEEMKNGSEGLEKVDMTLDLDFKEREGNIVEEEAREKEAKEEEAKEEEKEAKEKAKENEAKEEEAMALEDEKEEVELSLINKQWTNELKVYNIETGEWMSPEVSGDCPPPCVDFSFDCIHGRKAVLFGGYRPESGASSGAYILDMEIWKWTKIGDYEMSKGRFDWPVGRDGHASCVLSDTLNSQILISGGWDANNRLINDAWILNMQTRSWKKFPLPDMVGLRLWHRMVSYQPSPNFRQLLLFGGCPGAPLDASLGASTGSSWGKLASTILLEIGLVQKKVSVSKEGNKSRQRSIYRKDEKEWVILGSLNMSLMGDGPRRLKERVLLAEYKARKAEAQAQRAEKLARDTYNRLEAVLSRLENNMYSPTPSLMPADSMNSIYSVASMTSTKPAAPRKLEMEKPFWAISRGELEFTSEEVGRGKWGVVKVAYHKGERVAVRCLYSQIISEDNRRVFIESMNVAAKMRHNHILPFIGAVLGGEPIIVTELMPTNLKKVLDLGKFQNYQIVTIALDVANALSFLHTTRPDPVINGDLTSTSVLLQKQGGNTWRAKISDFMTAKFFHKVVSSSGMDSDRETSMSPTSDAPVFSHRSTTPHHAPFRTPSKLLSGSEASLSRKLSVRKRSQTAPDILDPATLTLQRDIYSFGLLLVEMCTGTPPLEVSLQFLAESITWTDINVVVKMCTEHDPARRPSALTLTDKLTTIHRVVMSKPSKFSIS